MAKNTTGRKANRDRASGAVELSESDLCDVLGGNSSEQVHVQPTAQADKQGRTHRNNLKQLGLALHS